MSEPLRVVILNDTSLIYSDDYRDGWIWGFQQIGCDVKVINRIVNGHTSVTPEVAVRLAAVFGTTPEFWLNAQQAVELQRASAGAENLVVGLKGRIEGPPDVRDLVRKLKVERRLPTAPELQAVRGSLLELTSYVAQVRKLGPEYAKVDVSDEVHALLKLSEKPRRKEAKSWNPFKLLFGDL